MSHFSVIVVTDKLDKDELAKRLQPFHEFECTGVSDEYVIDVDKTEEARAEYEAYKRTKWKDASGSFYDPSDDKYFRDPTPEEVEQMGPLAGTGFGHKMSWTSKDWGDGKGYRAKVHMNAEDVGMTEVEVPAPQIMTFAEFIEYYYGVEEDKHVYDEKDVDRAGVHQYGYVLLRKDIGRSGRKVILTDDVVEQNSNVLKYVDRTNPNKKWDWWVIGGRYGGRLRVKPGADAIKGGPSSFGMNDESLAALDYAKVSDIDFDAMYEATKQARIDYVNKAIQQIIEDYAKNNDGVILTELDVKEHWDFYRGAKKDVNTEWYGEWRMFNSEKPRDEQVRFEDWLIEVKGEQSIGVQMKTFGHVERHLSWGAGLEIMDDIEEYTSKGTPFRAFAFVALDGTWNEKGSMGWWGMVSDEKEGDAWEQTFTAFMDDLVKNHPDKYLAVVDCHI